MEKLNGHISEELAKVVSHTESDSEHSVISENELLFGFLYPAAIPKGTKGGGFPSSGAVGD